jgi:hypothetical protein
MNRSVVRCMADTQVHRGDRMCSENIEHMLEVPAALLSCCCSCSAPAAATIAAAAAVHRPPPLLLLLQCTSRRHYCCCSCSAPAGAATAAAAAHLTEPSLWLPWKGAASSAVIAAMAVVPPSCTVAERSSSANCKARASRQPRVL